MKKFSVLRDTPDRIAFAMITGLLLLRLVIVNVSPLEIGVDEAQYWRWSTTLDWGYYSKPPMIAWTIHASTLLFGDSEAGIRMFAPILHTVSAIFLWLLSRQMFGSKAGLITAAGYLLMPGIILSSTIISTDGVLFPFWSMSLYMLWQLREARGGWAHAALLGFGIGIGFLSKYAMLYFGIGLALTVLLDAPTRKAMLSLKGALVIAIAAAVIAPHIMWNAANEFQTVGHTLDNANLGADRYNPENLLTYFSDQMGIFGPVSFVALIAGVIFLRKGRSETTAKIETWLACFILPVIVIIAFQAFISRAHANWAATAYPAASILIASIFLRISASQRTWFFTAGLLAVAVIVAPVFTLVIRAMIALGFVAVILSAGFIAKWRPVGLFWSGIAIHLGLSFFVAAVTLGPTSWIAATGMDNTLKRVRGWQALADQVIARANELQPSAILVDEREIWHALDYYARDRLPAPLLHWRYNVDAKNYAEQQPMTNALDDNVLLVSFRSNRRERIQADYVTWRSEGRVGVELGQRSRLCDDGTRESLYRELRLYTMSDYEPLERTQAWVDRFKAEDANGQLKDTHMDRFDPCAPR
jgi:4-amino-4-deoxy-L-arabinose transferase-like glycosyltransferase